MNFEAFVYLICLPATVGYVAWCWWEDWRAIKRVEKWNEMAARNKAQRELG